MQETTKIPPLEEKIGTLKIEIKDLYKNIKEVNKNFNDDVYYDDEQQELIDYIQKAEKQKL